MGAFCSTAPPRQGAPAAEEITKLTTGEASDKAPRRLTDVDLRFQSESMRLLGYAGFWFVVIMGIVITNATKGWYPGGAPADLSDSLLTHVFGYNNICIYFDYPPANYVLPIVWAFVYLLLLCYLTVQWLEIQGRFDQGSYTYAQKTQLQAYLYVAALSILIFSNIFAVSPTGMNATLWIHTVPFWCLQLGMVCLAVGNTLSGLLAAPGRVNYWTELNLGTTAQQSAWAYVAIFALIVLFKIPAASNAMLSQRFFTQTPSFMWWAGLMDRGFLVCAAVMPMLKSVYLLAYRGELLHRVDVDFDVRKREAVRGKRTGRELYTTPLGERMSHVGHSFFVVLSTERVRLVGYAGFWLTVLSGIVITNATKGWYPGGAPADLSTSMLTQVFGYNNVCIYFDFPPANFILPIVWAAVMPAIVFYCLVDVAHAFGRWEDGNLTRGQYRFLASTHIVAAISVIIFSNIFAVSPTGMNATLWIHTVPFWGLQLGMVCLACGNTLQGLLAAPGRDNYWTELGFSRLWQQTSWAYVVIFAIIVLFKIPAAFNAMLGQPWWTQGPTFATVAGLFDRGFLFFAAVMPVLKSLFFLHSLGPELDVIAIATEIHVERKEGYAFKQPL
jgi:hypothetical protein